MEEKRLPLDATASTLDIPAEYLDSVVVQAYHLDITLDIISATFSGLVSIPVLISGPPRRVFYLHSAGLKLSRATVNGVPAIIVRDAASLTRATRLEVPEQAAAAQGASVFEIQFSGSISTTRTNAVAFLGHRRSSSSRGREEDFENYPCVEEN
ncbi:unnamed protein product, partial [Laminaria digitata]